MFNYLGDPEYYTTASEPDAPRGTISTFDNTTIADRKDVPPPSDSARQQSGNGQHGKDSGQCGKDPAFGSGRSIPSSAARRPARRLQANENAADHSLSSARPNMANPDRRLDDFIFIAGDCGPRLDGRVPRDTTFANELGRPWSADGGRPNGPLPGPVVSSRRHHGVEQSCLQPPQRAQNW